MHRIVRTVLGAGIACLAASGALGDVRLDLEWTTSHQVLLSWTDGSPYYQVFRSDDPAAVGLQETRIAETLDTTLTDTPPSGSVWFYRVRERGTCLEPVADSSVDSSFSTTNFGSSGTLQTFQNVWLSRKYAFMKFGLGGIPSDAVVTEASLVTQQTWSDGGDDLKLYDATGPWAESSITWSNKPANGSLWSQQFLPGGTGRRTWSITPLVREWVSGARTNDGLVLTMNETGEHHFSSREGGDPPLLCITWHDPAQDDLDRMTADSTAGGTARFEDGIAATTDGTVDVNLADPVQGSLEYLDRYNDLFRLDDPRNDLYLDRTFRWQGRTGVTFGRRVQNIPVLGESLLVLHDGTQVFGASSFVKEDRRYRGAVQISPQAARDAAVASMAQTHGDGTTFGEPMLVWVAEQPEGNDLRLAYRVPYAGKPVAGGMDFLTIMIDAETSEPLRTFSEELTGDRPGERFRVLDAGNTTNDFCWMLPLDRRPVWFDDDGATPDYPGPGADAYDDGPWCDAHSHDVYHYFYDTFGWSGFNGESASFSSYVHANMPEWNNASFTPFCNILQFGDGWAADDIVGHEFTHGIIGNTSGLAYRFQHGALNESLSDFFGTQIDLDWDIAENRRDSASGRIRNMNHPPDHGQPDHMDDYCFPVDGCVEDSDNGGVHTNSGIINKAFVLMTDGGIHGGLSTVGIGRSKAEQLTFSVMVSRLMSESLFHHFKDEMVREADLYRSTGRFGFTTQDVCDVINAFAAVGIGLPDSDCDGVENPYTDDGDGDTIPDGRDNCPMDPNVRQQDTDGDGAGDVCDIDIDGDGFINRRDGCPYVANNPDTDSDGDGIGDACDDDDRDGVLDVVDNCVRNYNPDQEDRDADGAGDACDGDLDGDGFLNASDQCPDVWSVTNTNWDGDNFGDDCDNCMYTYNNDQADADRDGQGDVCDNDRDGDGVPNQTDNCPDDVNAAQYDHDHNGVGTICDPAEREFFEGLSGAAEISLFLNHENVAVPIRIPIYPCSSADCPDVLGEGFRTEVTMSLTMEYQVRIVDDRGYVRSGPEAAAVDVPFTLGFAVDQEYFYLGGSQGPFQGRQYFVEMFAPPGSIDGQTLEGLMDVESIP